MKEKRSKKESNKEEAKQEGRNVTVFASFSEAAAPQENLKIDWPSFIRFFNDTLRRHGSAIPPLTVITKGKRVHFTNYSRPLVIISLNLNDSEQKQ